MWKKFILKDAIGAWLLMTACLAAGIILNEMRAAPLPLVYSMHEVPLNPASSRSSEDSAIRIQGTGDVNLAEMQEISASRAALILDARPEIFYRVGHIPSAMSLPRDDFDNSYRALAPVLQQNHGHVLVIYCSSVDCQDSQMVGQSLQRLGYSHVRLFRGGWNDWLGANLPEEK